MHVLFVHSNFPAQFRYLAPRLARDLGWRCTFVTRNATAPDVPGVERVVYRRRGGIAPGSHPCTRYFQGTVADAHGVYEAMKARPDIRPDLVVAHSGFGSSLFLPHLYDAPVVNFFEYYYHAAGGAFTFRPEVPVAESDLLTSGTNNSMILLDLASCDRGWCANFAQRDVMPKEYHEKIEVIPEGVDTNLYRRRLGSNARVLPDGTVIPDGTRVVTYVARGFELMRGFDVFMAAAKRIYEQFPDVVFVVAGTDQSYYLNDRRYTGGTYLRHRVLESGDFDRSRFHFTGWLSESQLIDVLSISDLHVYLTAPFITSWSMLDAMSCSCVVLASDQACTREYITHGRNGLLCDFFDAEGIARQAVEVLKDPAAYGVLGDAARITIEEEYSLDVSLPRVAAMFEGVAARGPRTPSVRCEERVRPGARAYWSPVNGHGEGREVGVGLPPFDGSIPFRLSGTGDPAVSDTWADGEENHGRVTRATAEDHGWDARATGEGDGRVAGATGGGKTVLFAWEVGAGMGHLMQMLPLAKDLAAAGHCVVMALRYLDRAVSVFGKAGVYFLQAPYRATGRRRPGRLTAFAQLLANLGFGDDNDLFGHASAWRNLIRSVGPDLLVCDYSPTALLAARDFPEMPRAVIGSGFCVPPDVPEDRHTSGANGDGKPRLAAWAPVRPGWLAADPLPALATEAEVLDRANWVLGNWGRPPMGRLGQLFSDADETFLVTFPELDHFRERHGAAYWGPVLDTDAGDEPAAPQWPDASGKRVFVYLKATPVLGEVLRALEATGQPSVAFVDGLDPEAAARSGSRTIHVSGRRLDVERACRECDVAILNGGHSVTSQMLLAGKPVLAVPLVLEQQMTGAALERLGAGASAPPRQGEPWEWAGKAKLEAVLGNDGYAQCARRFAERYTAFNPQVQRRAMLARAEELMANPAQGRSTAAMQLIAG